jgi:hypothetical protein
MTKKSKNSLLNEVEIYFIEGNCSSMPLTDIAEKLSRDIEFIKDVYDKARVKKALTFQTKLGSVAMTAAQSSKGDDIVRSSENEAYMKKFKNSIHKI